MFILVHLMWMKTADRWLLPFVWNANALLLHSDLVFYVAYCLFTCVVAPLTKDINKSRRDFDPPLTHQCQIPAPHSFAIHLILCEFLTVKLKCRFISSFTVDSSYFSLLEVSRLDCVWPQYGWRLSSINAVLFCLWCILKCTNTWMF